MSKNWSEYQKLIFDFPNSEHQHGLVQAGPGCAKSTTTVELLNRISESSMFMAFSSKIASSIQPKVPRNVDARTMNSFGWQLCRSSFPGVQLDDQKTMKILNKYVNMDANPQVFWPINAPIKRIVSILKNMGEYNTDNWQECGDRCGFELPDWSAKKDLYDAFIENLPLVYEESIKNTRYMDYDDQVFQPIFRDLPFPKLSYIMVDEAQDLNHVNIQMLKALVVRGARLMMVGDAYQAIFGFRGALTESMEILNSTFTPGNYQLPVCYRCPTAVIENARKINPALCSPNPNANGEGIVEHIKLEQFRERVQPGHFVTSRTTLPLVTEVIRLNVKGICAYVEGKEVTKTLFDLIDRIWYGRLQSPHNLGNLVDAYRKGADCSRYDVVHFIDEMNADRAERIPRLEREGRDSVIDSIIETTDTILAISEACNNVPQLIMKIEDTFKSPEDVTRPAVRAMTVHRIKGLENKVVHHLFSEDIPHKRAVNSGKEWQLTQERNLKFVADTRSQREYYYVQKPPKDQ